MKTTQNSAPQIRGYEVLAFGRFQLDPVRHVLHYGDKPLRLGSRALEILIALAERAGEVVGKEELIARVWPKSVVQEATLRVHIAALRKALGDGESGKRYVENFSGRGYRFVAHTIRRQVSCSLDDSNVSARPAPIASSHCAASLRVPLARIIGREQTIDALTARIPQRRFVTLVGPGGMGKTVVATAVTENLCVAYEHGARFVDLSTVQDPGLVPSVLATALNLEVPTEDSLQSALTFLKRMSMLIVLDNCEHVIEAAAGLAEKVLQNAPGVHLLATSREPLRAESEYVHRLTSLETPPPDAILGRSEMLAFPAVQLFVERASAVLDSFELHESDIPSLAELCYRLDGNPLAIELAAAMVDMFCVRGLAARLDDCLQLLTRGRRTALPRHQSLRATLDWSYTLLSPLEQIVLCRLAILSGSFGMESASVTVRKDEQINSAEVFDTVTNLVSKSLLTAEAAAGRVLYRMPDMTRAYALEKLNDSKARERARTRQTQKWFNSGPTTDRPRVASPSTT